MPQTAVLQLSPTPARSWHVWRNVLHASAASHVASSEQDPSSPLRGTHEEVRATGSYWQYRPGWHSGEVTAHAAPCAPGVSTTVHFELLSPSKMHCFPGPQSSSSPHTAPVDRKAVQVPGQLSVSEVQWPFAHSSSA